MHPRAVHLIEALQLEPHPEGGHYRRVHTSAETVGTAGASRPACTEIRFLLAAGECSAWHRIDADERWRWLEGDALRLSMFDEAGRTLGHVALGPSNAGHREEAVVPPGVWQRALPLGRYALAACRVMPGFAWEGFELLAEGSGAARELSRRGALHPPGRLPRADGCEDDECES